MQTKGKFYIDYLPRFIRFKIDKSQIPSAGLGCYAIEDIPKNSYGVYKGIMKKGIDADTVYAWMIEDYNKKTGEPINGKIIGYLDAKKRQQGNWSRYVNCGRTSQENNMIAEQKFGKIYYKTLRDIRAGEELFIDYGEGFREELKITY